MLVVGYALLGAVLGALLARPAYRLSVPYGQPPLAACASCGATFPAGLPGWTPFGQGARPESEVGDGAPQAAAGRPWLAAWGARCFACGARQGPRVWLTALVGAIAFGALGWAVEPAALPAFLVLAALGVLLAFIDLACLRLPDRIVAAAFVASVALLGLASMLLGDWGALVRAALGGLILGGLYLLLGLLPGARLGFGDVKLSVVLGFALGWVGWDAILLGALLPHIINGPVALALLVARKAGRKSEMPLGPALLAGAGCAVVLSYALAHTAGR